MKNKGFTLVELLAVIVLIAALALITVPSIINYVNQKESEISEVTQKLIYSGSELYLDSYGSSYPRVVGNQFCITLNDIVDVDYLSSPILDSVSGEEIDLNKFVKVNYVYSHDLKQTKYDYEIVDSCTSTLYTKACHIVSGDINTVGSEVNCAGEEFYIIPQDTTNHKSANDNTVSLLAKYNLNVGDNKHSDTPEGIQCDAIYQYYSAQYGDVPFADTEYWLGANEYSFVYNEKSTLYPYIENYKKYLEKLGVEKIKQATLMSYEQGQKMSSDYSSPTWLHHSNYWFGSVASDEISTEGHIYDSYNWSETGYNYTRCSETNPDSDCGVRPVIIIDKSSIQ